MSGPQREEKEADQGMSVSSMGPSVGLFRPFSLLRIPLYAAALHLWAAAAATAVAGFAFWTLVARFYSAQDVGLGSAALSALTLLATFSHLGLGLGIIRFLPESGRDAPRLVNVMWTTAALVAAVSSLVFLLGIPLWAPDLAFLRERPLYALAFVAFGVTSTVSGIQLNAFMAMRKAKYVLLKTLLLQIPRLALPALLVGLWGAFGIILSGGLALSAGAIIGFALMIKGMSGYRPAPVLDLPAVARLLPFSAANYLADLLLLAPSLVLPLMVVSILGSAQGAYFYMAWFLAYILTSASTYLSLSLFAEGSHDPAALPNLSRNAVLAGLAVASMGALILVLAADKVLLLFGRDYAAEGADLLRVVAVAALPAAVVNVYLGALRVTKQVGELVIISGVVAITTLSLSYALLPSLGLIGAGVGQGLGQGLGLAIVMARLLTASPGPVSQRMRWLLITLTGRS